MWLIEQEAPGFSLCLPGILAASTGSDFFHNLLQTPVKNSPACLSLSLSVQGLSAWHSSLLPSAGSAKASRGKNSLKIGLAASLLRIFRRRTGQKKSNQSRSHMALAWMLQNVSWQVFFFFGLRLLLSCQRTTPVLIVNSEGKEIRIIRDRK